jgi:hypothetical protein
VRKAKAHFSFFLFHFSFPVEKESRLALGRKEEGKRKKEKYNL